MDRFDTVAVVGFASLVIASTIVDGRLAAAAFGGFLLSLAVWRLYDGRPWEALGWVSWTVAAVAIPFEPAGAAFLVAFLGPVVVGLAFVLGDRLELLPDVWTVEVETRRG